MSGDDPEGEIPESFDDLLNKHLATDGDHRKAGVFKASQFWLNKIQDDLSPPEFGQLAQYALLARYKSVNQYDQVSRNPGEFATDISNRYLATLGFPPDEFYKLMKDPEKNEARINEIIDEIPQEIVEMFAPWYQEFMNNEDDMALNNKDQIKTPDEFKALKDKQFLALAAFGAITWRTNEVFPDAKEAQKVKQNIINYKNRESNPFGPFMTRLKEASAKLEQEAPKGITPPEFSGRISVIYKNSDNQKEKQAIQEFNDPFSDMLEQAKSRFMAFATNNKYGLNEIEKVECKKTADEMTALYDKLVTERSTGKIINPVLLGEIEQFVGQKVLLNDRVNQLKDKDLSSALDTFMSNPAVEKSVESIKDEATSVLNNLDKYALAKSFAAITHCDESFKFHERLLEIEQLEPHQKIDATKELLKKYILIDTKQGSGFDEVDDNVLLNLEGSGTPAQIVQLRDALREHKDTLDSLLSDDVSKILSRCRTLDREYAKYLVQGDQLPTACSKVILSDQPVSAFVQLYGSFKLDSDRRNIWQALNETMSPKQIMTQVATLNQDEINATPELKNLLDNVKTTDYKRGFFTKLRDVVKDFPNKIAENWKKNPLRNLTEIRAISGSSLNTEIIGNNKIEKPKSTGPKTPKNVTKSQSKGSSLATVKELVQKELHGIMKDFIPSGDGTLPQRVVTLMSNAADNILKHKEVTALDNKGRQQLVAYLSKPETIEKIYKQALDTRVVHFYQKLQDPSFKLESKGEGLNWMHYPRARRDVIEILFDKVQKNEGGVFKEEQVSSILEKLRVEYVSAIRQDFPEMNQERAAMLLEKLGDSPILKSPNTSLDTSLDLDNLMTEFQAMSHPDKETSQILHSSFMEDVSSGLMTRLQDAFDSAEKVLSSEEELTNVLTQKSSSVLLSKSQPEVNGSQMEHAQEYVQAIDARIEQIKQHEEYNGYEGEKTPLQENLHFEEFALDQMKKRLEQGGDVQSFAAEALKESSASRKDSMGMQGLPPETEILLHNIKDNQPPESPKKDTQSRMRT